MQQAPPRQPPSTRPATVNMAALTLRPQSRFRAPLRHGLVSRHEYAHAWADVGSGSSGGFADIFGTPVVPFVAGPLVGSIAGLLGLHGWAAQLHGPARTRSGSRYVGFQG